MSPEQQQALEDELAGVYRDAGYSKPIARLIAKATSSLRARAKVHHTLTKFGRLS